MKSNKWWVHLPGEVYANSFCFDERIGKKEFREYLLSWLGCRRAPRGTQMWAERRCLS